MGSRLPKTRSSRLSLRISKLRQMRASRSRLRRQLDDDDYFAFAAARIVQTFSNKKQRPGGSVPGHVIIYRDREGGHRRMFQDYLADNPTYGPDLFRRRFRMNRDLFLRIMNGVEAHYDYFVQKRDAAGRLGPVKL